jgi:hypothetical protein
VTELVEDAIDVCEDFVVGEPEYTEPECFEVFLTSLVLIGLQVVSGAVDFDHEADVRAVEVDDETVDRMLSAEVQAELLAPERLPQAVLSVRG